MHSAVMQNKAYIDFAKDNTVEVLSLSGLDRAVNEKDEKAATYKKDRKEYMVEWPSLTFDEIMDLSRGPASKYNDSRAIPYTCIVDPYTEEKLGFGYRDPKSIMAAVEEFTPKLAVKGKSFKAELAEAAAYAEQGDFTRALSEIKKVKPKGRMSKSVKAKIEARKDAAAEAVVKKAQEKIDETLALPPAEAVPALKLLLPKLRGTDLDRDLRRKIKELEKEIEG